MSVMAILVWLLIAVAIIAAAALVLPFGIRVEADLDGSPRGRLTVQPFGTFGPWLALWETGKTPPSRKERTPVKRGKPSGSAKRLVKAGFRLAGDILSLFRLRAFVIDLRFGCEDPADTGQLFGAMAPFLYGTQGLERAHIHVEPVFGQKVLTGRAMVEVAIVPIALLPPVLRFGRASIGRSR